MPKIRIKEKDLTTNPRTGVSDNFIFIASTENTVSEITEGTTEFEKKVLSLGGRILKGSWAAAKTYLGDRNQFDVKFILVDNETSEDAISTDLSAALEVVQKRKDCAIILTAASSTLAAATTTALTADCNYIENAGTEKGNVTDKKFFSDELKKPVGKYVIPVYANKLTSTEVPNLTAGQAWILAFLNSVNILGNPEWLAIAGATRGALPVVTSVGTISEDALDKMQPTVYDKDQIIAVNPICDVRPWGVRIWGNRTALPNTNIEASAGTYDSTQDQLVATSFANIRVALCDIKKALYKASRHYQFEQNSDVLWVNFTSDVNPLLEELKQSYGIAGYRWFRQESTERAKISALLRVTFLESIEDFDLTIELRDSLEVEE